MTLALAGTIPITNKYFQMKQDSPEKNKPYYPLPPKILGNKVWADYLSNIFTEVEGNVKVFIESPKLV